MDKPIIYKPIVTSQDIVARNEIIAYLQEHYDIEGIKPDMVRFRIADEKGELLENPSWEFDLEDYLQEMEKASLFQRVKAWFKRIFT